MPTLTCTTHPENPAAFACDGCARRLCEECIEESHRLILCRHCGERALPLEAGIGATVQEREQAAQWQAAAVYSVGDALGYVFRGVGAFAFWTYLIVVVIARLPFLGFVASLFLLLVALTLPAFLFKIARTTTRGDNELPDWPELELFSILADILRFVWVGLWCLLPTAALFLLFGCDESLIATEELSRGCLLVMALGLFVGTALWIPAFAATALFETGWLSFRFDLHARVAKLDLAELGTIVLVVGGLVAGAPVLSTLLSFVPLLGGVLGEGVTLYALFTGAHLAGVYFRRHAREVREIYLG